MHPLWTCAVRSGCLDGEGVNRTASSPPKQQHRNSSSPTTAKTHPPRHTAWGTGADSCCRSAFAVWFPELSCAPFPPTPLPRTITPRTPLHPAPNSCAAPRLPLFRVETCQGTGSEGQQSSRAVAGRFHAAVNWRRVGFDAGRSGFSRTVERRNLALTSRGSS